MFSCPAWRRWGTGFTRAKVLLEGYNEGQGARGKGQGSANSDRPQNPNWMKRGEKGVVDTEHVDWMF